MAEPIIQAKSSSGTPAALSLDSAGNLNVNVQAGGAGGGPVTAISGAFVDGAIATLGTKADAAQIDPTQAASVIALLKALQTELIDIEAQTTLTPTVNGSVTANAGTNLNTSLLALETGGNLATLAGIVSSAKAAIKAASGDIADGAIATLGTKADAKSTATDTTAVSIMAVLKEISAMVQAPASTPVTGTFWQATQPVSGTVTANEGGTWTVGSNSATGSAVPANAFYEAGIAKTSLPSAASDGNLTGAMVDKFGRQVVLPGTIRDLVGSTTTTISASTSETTIISATASTFHDLTAVMVSNTSGTATRVDFRDTTGGSVIFSIYVPAGDVRGAVFSTPQPQTSVNTNWTAQSSASVTDLRVFAQYISNK